MGPDALAQVLRPLAGAFGAPNPDVLVGLDAADDAAVYRLNDEQAIVATADFFPPVVDDPYTFGAVAAANALSDIYAMGGDPLFCLNLVAFPDDLEPAILTDILRGGVDKVREAGAVIAGGHTVTDQEPKYGLAAIGTVHPARILTKGGARPGDALLLTKPLGTGLVTTALKQQAVEPADYDACVASMAALNGPASRALRSLGAAVHACTDITGFGLLGHALEMAQLSGVRLRFELASLPILPGARSYAERGFVPGGTGRNVRHVKPFTTYGPALTEVDELLLCDPQTSGGLFAAIDPSAVEQALAALRRAGVEAVTVGTAQDGAGLSVE
jgi:selenide, water dikinase